MAEFGALLLRRTEQPLATIRNLFLIATLAVSSMIPWYTLRMLPLLTIGTAKINLLDVLVLCAVLAGFPSVVRKVLARDLKPLWVCLFLVYTLLIPLAIGIQNPVTRFEAVREARALAFYALILVFIAGDYHPGDFRWFTVAYVTGALIGVSAVFIHMRWLTPLPGYTPGTGAGAVDPTGCRVLYIDWTVALSAFVLTTHGVLTASRRHWCVVWTAGSLAVGWCLLVTASRATQGISAAAIVLLIALLVIGGGVRLRLIGIGITVALGCATILVLGAIVGPFQTCNPVGLSLSRWSTVLTDDSVTYRIREFKTSLGIVKGKPLFGEGLGGTIPDPGVIKNGKLVYGPPIPELASGYLFLLVKTGVLGLGLFLAMVSSVVRMAWGNLRRARGTHLVSWYALAISGIAALLTLNLIDNVVDIPQAVVALSLFAGMAKFDAN